LLFVVPVSRVFGLEKQEVIENQSKTIINADATETQNTRYI
jgi:hypothetical protein